MVDAFVRIQKITINNFKNIEFGTIDLTHSKKEGTFVDIVGLYGQNGSGKTALIDSLAVLKAVLSGRKLLDDYANYILKGKESAHLSFDFDLQSGLEKFKVEYRFDMVLKEKNNESNIGEFEPSGQYRVAIENEVLSIAGNVAGKKIKMQTIMDTSSAESPFTPNTKFDEIMGSDSNLKGKLLLGKQLANERSQSFLFSSEFLTTMKDTCKVDEYTSVLKSLVIYGNYYLYIVDMKSVGLIHLNAALPFFFRFDNKKSLSTGSIAIKLEGVSIVPKRVFDIVDRAISNLNTVLEQLIPGLNVKLENLGVTLLPDKSEGYTVELVSKRNDVVIPLRFESEGIKKIISILQLLISMHNNKGMTVAIDELDAGIFEYLLGELLKIISESGKGQLIFTSHNLRPLETIDKKHIYFTTTNPRNRYIQLTNVQTNNNLRYFYYRDLILGGQKEELYNLTNNYEIALSLKEAGEFDGN